MQMNSVIGTAKQTPHLCLEGRQLLSQQRMCSRDSELHSVLFCRSDLEEVANFPLKKCSLCSYSNGGQLFAAAGVGNIITVWSAVTHQVLATFKVGSCTFMAMQSGERDHATSC